MEVPVAAVETTLPAAPGRVFRVLEDARSLRYLVPGARRIRRFDARWPEPGTVVAHSIGVAPIAVRDETVAVSAEAPHHLVLDASIRPFGRFRVTFDLVEEGSGTRLTMKEWPTGGPVSLPGMRQMMIVALHLRNLETCRRLRRVVVRREQQRGERGDRA